MNPLNATIALLIRHAHTDAVGVRLTGRLPGISLSAAGGVQAERLGRTLSSTPLASIYTSPLERAQQTARAIARHQAAPVHASASLNEIDFGDWTGRTFAELAGDSGWRAFNDHRASAAVPNGERPIDLQQRIVSALADFAHRHAGRTFAVVTHAELVRSAVLYFLGSSLDVHHRLEIGPASVTAVSLGADGPRLLYVNNLAFAVHTEPSTEGAAETSR